MNWSFPHRRKLRIALLLGAVFVFIFGKNWLDQKNVSELGSSFSSVYEDRLVAESYIYKLSDHLYQKKTLLNGNYNPETSNLPATIHRHNAAIHTIVSAYEKTKLTQSESAFFRDLKNNIAAINTLEVNYLNELQVNPQGTGAELKLNKQYELASDNLRQLSDIQVAEGKILNDKSKQIIAGSNLLKDFELALLMGLILVMYSLILTTKSVLAKIPHKPSLN